MKCYIRRNNLEHSSVDIWSGITMYVLSYSWKLIKSGQKLSREIAYNFRLLLVLLPAWVKFQSRKLYVERFGEIRQTYWLRKRQVLVHQQVCISLWAKSKRRWRFPGFSPWRQMRQMTESHRQKTRPEESSHRREYNVQKLDEELIPARREKPSFCTSKRNLDGNLRKDTVYGRQKNTQSRQKLERNCSNFNSLVHR